jgi:2-polyprenyl-3-methyl-5-hydroxy-6-metoxy-1,4-benzoquinol methylase
MDTTPTTTHAPGLVLTGERTLPGIDHENYWFQRHVVAYDLVARGVADARVLDAGCGEGYGLKLLADAGARGVVGADLEARVVEHIRATYAADDARIDAVACELMDLPLDEDSVDVTVSFQVIEHLYDIPGYLASMRRVTRPGGAVWIATPNRLTFTPGSDTPVNPFHTREFTAAELREQLTAAGLEVRTIVGVHHPALLALLERATGRTLVDLQTARDPASWPWWLRTLVGRFRPSWFRVRTDRLDASLDLIAVCRVPGAS